MSIARGKSRYVEIHRLYAAHMADSGRRPGRKSILRWPVLVGAVGLVAVVVVIAVLVSSPSSPTARPTASGRTQPAGKPDPGKSSGGSPSTQQSSPGSGSGSADSDSADGDSSGAGQAQACSRLPGALAQQMADLILRVGSKSPDAVTWLQQEANSYHQAAQLVSSGSELAKTLAAVATDMQNLESDLSSGKDGPVNGLETKTSQDLEAVYTLCD